jgi:hypothetical protein
VRLGAGGEDCCAWITAAEQIPRSAAKRIARGSDLAMNASGKRASVAEAVEKKKASRSLRVGTEYRYVFGRLAR